MNRKYGGMKSLGSEGPGGSNDMRKTEKRVGVITAIALTLLALPFLAGGIYYALDDWENLWHLATGAMFFALFFLIPALVIFIRIRKRRR
ncbi:MAG: hypothetical protein ACK4ND_08315 [Cytophagaceae bacterium]